MAKIEEILRNWKWDEEKIRKYLEEFKKYLNSNEGKEELQIRNKIKLKAQNYLKDEESIDKLSNEELKELLLMVNTIRTYEEIFRSRERPIISEIDKGNIEYIKQIKNWLKDLIKIQEEDQLPKGPENFTAKTASELLTFRYPEKFYIVNGASIKGLNELRSVNLSDELKDSHIEVSNYPKFRPLFEYLKDKINKVIEEKLGKRADYYDVDHFLYFISKQNKKSEKNKTDESQDKNKESAINAETDKKLETEKQKEESKISLKPYFQYKGFYFDQDLITAFYAALKTKGFVILSGLTGTGKTRLAQLFAELLCPKCNPQDKQNTKIAQESSANQNQCDCTHLFLSVRPDWRDSKALLGYYNFITERYERTPLLDFILKARNDYETNKNNANPFFIILDEMNLSHVEYYFADFLSVLESGRDESYMTKETIKLHNIDKEESNDKKEDIGKNAEKEDKSKNKETVPIPKEIKLPPNLYIIGSVNIDETTYMFSPKVLDRAFAIEFWDVDFDNCISFNINIKKVKIKIDEDKAKEIAVSIHSKLLEDLRNKKTKSENNKQNNNKQNSDQVRFCGVVGDKEEIKDALKCIKDDEKNKVRSGKSIFEELKELNQILQLYDLHFGYRVLDEIALFIKYAMNAPNEVGQLSSEKALDFAVFMKVLPKFHGPRQKLERPLRLVLKWCAVNKAEFDNKQPGEIINLLEDLLKEKVKLSEKFKYPRTAIKVLRMLRQLYETGFASFA